MSDRDPLVHIRMPDELRKTLQQRAKEGSRSMNAEIVHRLQRSLAQAASNNLTPRKKPQDEEGDAILGLWHEMSPTQRRTTVAMLEAMLDVDSAGSKDSA